MKETVNVNIGSEAFILDEDAHRVLGNYFNDICRRLPEDDTETMGDVEIRMAEIFRERISSPMQVITLEMARNAMNRMGSPAEFGDCRTTAESKTAEKAAPKSPKLYRSLTNRSIAGICGGLGDFFDIDPTLLRLVTLFLILFGGLSIWVYIILWIVIPEAPIRKFNINKNK